MYAIFLDGFTLLITRYNIGLNKVRFIGLCERETSLSIDRRAKEDEHQNEECIAYSRAYGHIFRSILRVAVRSVPTPGQMRKSRTTMDNPWSALVVLLLRDPHVLEGRQAGENGTSNPDAVLAFRRGDHSHSHTVRREVGELFAHAVGDAGIHGRPTGEDDVAVSDGKGVRNLHVGGEPQRLTGRAGYRCRRRRSEEGISSRV